MNALARLATMVYRLLMACYPADFRASFGVEMQSVFTQAIADCTKNGKAVTFILRELRYLPGNLLRQHWANLTEEKVPMTTLTESNSIQVEDRQPGTWGAAFLAGIPHLLMGLLVGLGRLAGIYVYETSQTIEIIIGTALALLVVGILIFAWRHGWPLWSASWYLYGTWVSVAIIGLTIERLNLEESWRYTNALFLGWILLCIIGYFIILSKSKLHGLLSVAFLFPMLGVMLLEFIPNPIEGWLTIGLGLLTALTAGAIVRLGDFRFGLGLVLGLNVVAGLSLAYISEYKMHDLPNGISHIPKFGNFLEILAFYSIFGLGVVALPFILRGLWNFGRRKLAS